MEGLDSIFNLGHEAGAPEEKPDTKDGRILTEWRFGYLVTQGYRLIEIVNKNQMPEERKHYRKFGDRIKVGVGAYDDNGFFNNQRRAIFKKL